MSTGSDAPTWRQDRTPLATLAAALERFNTAREWQRFHTPKDLAMALAVEASELLELFLWRDVDGPLPAGKRLEEELGDVLITLTNLAGKLGVDLMDAAQRKLALNAVRYPVSTAKGSARKYNAPPEEGGSEGGEHGGGTR